MQLNLPCHGENPKPTPIGRERISRDPEHISQPIQRVMTDLNARILMNGLDREVRQIALQGLFDAGNSPEQIEAMLMALVRERPSVFSQKKVQGIVEWAEHEWQERINPQLKWG